MATSPNYGWLEPDNTDLVKNGALAIRTLGNAIDSTMATMVPKSIVDAKGDLIAGTAADTAARLAVGNNGETLVADSSTATGLRYQSAYNGNGIINGGMDIWQRGTSFALTSPQLAYTADRWMGRHLGTNVTYSQQTSGLTGIQYSLRVQRPNGTTGTNEQIVYYQFETPDSYRFAGQTVTLSFWAKAGANFSPTSSIMTVGIISGTGTNQNVGNGAYTGQAFVAAENKTLTTSWQRFTTTGTVSASATQIGIYFTDTPTGTAGANDWFEITGVQLELGSVATSFKRSGSGGGTIQGELAACQRYYERTNNTSTNTAYAGFNNSTTVAYASWVYKVRKRVNPTITMSAVADFAVRIPGGSNAGLSAYSVIGSNIDNSWLSGTASGLTSGNGSMIVNLGDTGYLEASSEL